ncbi:hypothetical protein LRQ04_17930 [Paenarthrobacter sp. AR 02]|uniref:hypothetical protein n=1 Tax=Paenarthrobacter sp. AR 02 TaxID=2899821 RepID=UPI001F3D9A6E|nr:hypothetical protein [Paenarthrobacter sp. AR 02]MCF3141132.1 hypothetical protein [Paenarthrobacter sp. AR 02]
MSLLSAGVHRQGTTRIFDPDGLVKPGRINKFNQQFLHFNVGPLFRPLFEDVFTGLLLLGLWLERLLLASVAA